MEMREEFEKWYLELHPNCSPDQLRYIESIGTYDSDFKAGMYHTFCQMKRQMVKQEPVATLLSSDPYDERDGFHLSIEDSKRLAALPAGTKLYASPVQQSQAEQQRDELLKALNRLNVKYKLDIAFGFSVAENNTTREIDALIAKIEGGVC